MGQVERSCEYRNLSSDKFSPPALTTGIPLIKLRAAKETRQQL